MSARASIDLLAWESEFFGRRLGRVVFDDAAPRLTPSALTGFALVQAKVAAQATAQMDALSAIGFRPVEGEMDCCYTLPACAGGAPVAGAAALPAAEMRLAGEADISALRALAAQTLVQSRFRAPWFSDEERQRFYAQWVANAVRGSFDHLCLVAQGPDGISGLVTLRDIGGQAARIGLLAVSPAARGRGTGKLLCRAALGWCRSRGFRQLWVATQTANLPALRLYLASGARVVHAAHWLYRGPHDSI
ncbi:TDP-fucosamine acetyltransferase [Sodalis praecaptivus]|uniref:dTDP-fucosamine acetyltransferase n=1 Tax=Sodalis praecaptivus TaxID=1239307 RepID=W0HT62_9GAMM|nr:dTDP-4-amino-4,6-dideoxy-D-galactose acyltransferase [Sodalis praecaptivus]AHF75405.1 TDP-fucosamine acetyltransferase [Sodalis praecaptivus]